MSAPIFSLRAGMVGYGGPPLFAAVDLYVARGDHACLVGRNGSGKSTLLKIIAGALEQDQGEIYREPGLRVAWVEQEPRFPDATMVAAYVGAGRYPDYQVAAALAEFGLDGERLLTSLSGGEGRRATLARAFVTPPDLLLLDEPTNHLDLAAIEALERRLTAFTGALLVVSHDRAFLANVTNRIFWLERGRLRSAERGFADFEDWREEVLDAEQRALEKLDARLADETRWLLHGVTARRKRNQGRLVRLEAMRAQRAVLIGGRGKLRLEAKRGELRSKLVIEAERIAKNVGEGDDERQLITDFSTLVLRGDRIGVVGPNGAGKTTLLKMLIGELPPDRGRVAVANNLALAYFDQRREQLDPKKTLRDVLIPQGGDTVTVQGRPRHVRAYLRDFLFDPRQVDSPCGMLSGGERNRLLLAKILATPADLLVLDEPTNDLDTDTLDLLQELLAEFGGTLLLVSHDRDFLDKTVTSTIVLPGDGSATEYAGGYADAMAQRGQAAVRAGVTRAAPARPASAPQRPPRPRQQLSYNEQRELDLLPERIAKLEAELDRLETMLADPDLFVRDAEAFRSAAAQLETARRELGEAEELWLALEHKRSELERLRMGSGESR